MVTTLTIIYLTINKIQNKYSLYLLQLLIIKLINCRLKNDTGHSYLLAVKNKGEY